MIRKKSINLIIFGLITVVLMLTAFFSISIISNESAFASELICYEDFYQINYIDKGYSDNFFKNYDFSRRHLEERDFLGNIRYVEVFDPGWTILSGSFLTDIKTCGHYAKSSYNGQGRAICQQFSANNFVGKTVTLTFLARSTLSSGFSIYCESNVPQVVNGYTYNFTSIFSQSISGLSSDNYILCSVTFDIPSDTPSDALLTFGINVGYSSGDLYIASAMLEIGSSFSKFVPNSQEAYNDYLATFNSGITFADSRLNEYSTSYTVGYNNGVLFADNRLNEQSTSYITGYDDGENFGYESGYDEGYAEGISFADSRVLTISSSYTTGYNNGITFADNRLNEHSTSYTTGYNNGITFADDRVNSSSMSYTFGFNNGVAYADEMLNEQSASYITGYDRGIAYADSRVNEESTSYTTAYAFYSIGNSIWSFVESVLTSVGSVGNTLKSLVVLENGGFNSGLLDLISNLLNFVSDGFTSLVDWFKSLFGG